MSNTEKRELRVRIPAKLHRKLLSGSDDYNVGLRIIVEAALVLGLEQVDEDSILDAYYGSGPGPLRNFQIWLVQVRKVSRRSAATYACYVRNSPIINGTKTEIRAWAYTNPDMRERRRSVWKRWREYQRHIHDQDVSETINELRCVS